MILDINAACTDVQLLNILSIVKGLITLATIIVPVILVIFVIIDIIKTTSSADVDTKKLFKSVSKRVIAAFLIFLVPALVNLVLNIVPSGNLYYLDCYQNASKNKVVSISISNVESAMTELQSAISTASSNKTKENYNEAQRQYELVRKEVKLIPDKSKRKQYETTLEGYKTTLNNIKSSLSSYKDSTTVPSDNLVISSGTIFIGDSRTVGMCKAKSLCNSKTENGKEICDSEQCIAEVGAGYTWYANTAISKVNDILNNNPNKKYNIVVNMGVNDAGKTGGNASEYAKLFNNLASGSWKNQNIIILSVNPVIDGKSNTYTSGVEKFNEIIKDNLLSSIKYCDSYHNVNITPSSDGLHYSNETSIMIYNYITNSCI